MLKQTIVCTSKYNAAYLTEGKEYEVLGNRENHHNFSIRNDMHQTLSYESKHFTQEDTTMPTKTATFIGISGWLFTKGQEYQVQTTEDPHVLAVKSPHYTPLVTMNASSFIIKEDQSKPPKIVISNVNFAPFLTKGKEYQLLEEVNSGIQDYYQVIVDNNQRSMWSKDHFTIKPEPIKETPMPTAKTVTCINNVLHFQGSKSEYKYITIGKTYNVLAPLEGDDTEQRGWIWITDDRNNTSYHYPSHLFTSLDLKYAVCIKKDSAQYITEGKEYQVTAHGDNEFKLVGDQGKEVYYVKDHFRVIDKKEETSSPSSISYIATYNVNSNSKDRYSHFTKDKEYELIPCLDVSFPGVTTLNDKNEIFSLTENSFTRKEDQPLPRSSPQFVKYTNALGYDRRNLTLDKEYQVLNLIEKPDGPFLILNDLGEPKFFYSRLFDTFGETPTKQEQPMPKSTVTCTHTYDASDLTQGKKYEVIKVHDTEPIIDVVNDKDMKCRYSTKHFKEFQISKFSPNDIVTFIGTYSSPYLTANKDYIVAYANNDLVTVKGNNGVYTECRAKDFVKKEQPMPAKIVIFNQATSPRFTKGKEYQVRAEYTGAYVLVDDKNELVHISSGYFIQKEDQPTIPQKPIKTATYIGMSGSLFTKDKEYQVQETENPDRLIVIATDKQDQNNVNFGRKYFTIKQDQKIDIATQASDRPDLLALFNDCLNQLHFAHTQYHLIRKDGVHDNNRSQIAQESTILRTNRSKAIATLMTELRKQDIKDINDLYAKCSIQAPTPKVDPEYLQQIKKRIAINLTCSTNATWQDLIAMKTIVNPLDKNKSILGKDLDDFINNLDPIPAPLYHDLIVFENPFRLLGGFNVFQATTTLKTTVYKKQDLISPAYFIIFSEDKGLQFFQA